MEDLLLDINNLKSKIMAEIDAFGFSKDLKHLRFGLALKVYEYKYDSNDELSLKKYRGYLEDFYSGVIIPINKLLINNKNESIYDNREVPDIEKQGSLETQIEETLSYIKENFPSFLADISSDYYSLKNNYLSELESTKDTVKRRLESSLDIPLGASLSLFGDTSSLLKNYLVKLELFIKIKLSNVSIFVENDKKIKEMFKRAYDSLKEPDAVEAITQLANNYSKSISECLQSDAIFQQSNILAIQENMINNGLQIDNIIKITTERNEMHEAIVNMNYNVDLPVILKLESYVENSGLYEEEFYEGLYAVIEKEKYIKAKKYIEPVIYPQLSDKSKYKLECMFIERLKELNEEEAQECVLAYKRDGYINALDKEYMNFFDACTFSNKAIYEGVPIEYFKYKYEYNYIRSRRKSHHIELSLDDYEIKPVILGIGHDVVGPVGPYLKVKEEYRRRGFNYHCFIYYDLRTGKEVRPFGKPKSATKELYDYANGKYIVVEQEDLYKDNKYFELYDENFRQYQQAWEHGDVILPDRTRGDFLMVPLSSHDSYCLLCHDGSAKMINFRNYDFSDAYSMHPFEINDGVITFDLNGKGKRMCHFDLDTMHVIGDYDDQSDKKDYSLFSEGEYVYYDERTKLYGYKNRAGEQVTPPIFVEAYPIFNGVGRVIKTINCFDTRGVVNKDGDFTCLANAGFSSESSAFVTDLKELSHIYIKKYGKSFRARATNSYALDDNRPIREINIKIKPNKVLVAGG